MGFELAKVEHILRTVHNESKKTYIISSCKHQGECLNSHLEEWKTLKAITTGIQFWLTFYLRCACDLVSPENMNFFILLVLQSDLQSRGPTSS